MEKPLAWLRGEIKTPPFSASARIEAGYLLRRVQQGEKLSLPQSRPMPAIGPRCHELRVRDRDHTWRIVYRVDPRCHPDSGDLRQKDHDNAQRRD